jgi:hypothetical protein
MERKVGNLIVLAESTVAPNNFLDLKGEASLPR